MYISICNSLDFIISLCIRPQEVFPVRDEVLSDLELSDDDIPPATLIPEPLKPTPVLKPCFQSKNETDLFGLGFTEEEAPKAKDSSEDLEGKSTTTNL